MNTTEEAELAALAEALGGSRLAAVRMSFSCGRATEVIHKSLLRPSFVCSTVVASGASDENGSNTHVSTRSGLLVGVIRADENGGLFLCDVGRASAIDSANGFVFAAVAPGDARLVVAPPPTPSLRDALIYVRDWRRLPLSGQWHAKCRDCPGVYEVLLSDVVILSESPVVVHKRLQGPSASFSLLQDLDASCRGKVNVRGSVRCKSAVLASRSTHPTFLMELGSLCKDGRHEDVILVVFSGREAMQWWPFLSSGHHLGFIGLSVVSLPSKRNRRVLRAKGPELRVVNADAFGKTVNITDGSSETHGETIPAQKIADVSTSPLPRKRAHAALVEPRPMRFSEGQSQTKQNICSLGGHLITYKGEVTGVMADGRFELDHCLMLHLGAYGGWCAGPEAVAICFREGAHVVIVEATVAFRRGHPAALFPTARSVAYLSYFGSLPTSPSGILARRSFRESPWRRLWRNLSSPQILWAEELYVSLKSKFGSWCASQASDSQDEAAGLLLTSRGAGATDLSVVESLLGSAVEDGLVSHIMQMHSGLTETAEPSTRRSDMYDEFLSATGSDCNISPSVLRGDYPLLPMMADVIHACDALHLVKKRCAVKTGIGVSRSGLVVESTALEYGASRSGDAGRVLAGERTLEEQNSSDVHQFSLSKSSRSGGRKPRALREDEIVKSAHASVTFPLDCNAVKTTPRVASSRQDTSAVLVGCLDSTPDSKGALCLFDATGSMEVLALGSLSPRFLGAIVQVPVYAILSTRDIVGNAERAVIFDASSIVAVIGKEFESTVAKAFEKTQGRSQYSVRTGHGQKLSIVCSQKSGLPATSSSFANEEPDERPLVAIYVTKVTIRTVSTTGLSSFTLRGRLLASKRSRRHPSWVYLGDDERGFLECLLCVEGELAAPLHAMVQCFSVYEITCTEILGVHDVLSWVWMRGFPSPSDEEIRQRSVPYEVHLSTHDEDRRIWLYVLDAAEIASDFDTEEEQSVVEAAVESWQLGEGVANSREKVMVDISDLIAQSQQQLSDHVRFRGLFVRADAANSPSTNGPDGLNIGSVSHVVLRDCFVPVLHVRVRVCEKVMLPPGLLPGLIVDLSDVAATKSSDSAEIDYSLSASSSIRILSKSLNSLMERRPSICCQRPLASAPALSGIPAKYLYSFTTVEREGSGSSHHLGIVSLTITCVISVRLFVQEAAFGHALCDFCGEDNFALCGELVADVSDGTARGRMICHGVRNVLEVLSAGEYDSMLLRRTLLEEGNLQYNNRNSGIAPKPMPSSASRGKVATPREMATEILDRLVRVAPRNAVVISNFSGREVSDGENTFNMTGNIDLGRGRKLPTAVHGSAELAGVECLALFENSAWRHRVLSRGDSSVLAIDLVNVHHDAVTGGVEDGETST